MPTWNRLQYCLECLKSLHRQILDAKKLEIIVVDNGSSDDTVAAVTKKFPRVKIISLNKNYGFSVAVNQGIKRARGKYISIMQNDLRPAANYFSEMLAALKKSSTKEAIFGPKVYKFGSNNRLHFCCGELDQDTLNFKIIGHNEDDYGQYDKVHEADIVAFSGLVIKREVFKRIGRLDERLFITFMDTDFFVKAKRAGFKCVFVSRAKIWDKGTTTYGIDSPQNLYYLTRNQLILLNDYQAFSVWRHLKNLRYFFSTGMRLLLPTIDRSKHAAVLLGILDFYRRKYGEAEYY